MGRIKGQMESHYEDKIAHNVRLGVARRLRLTLSCAFGAGSLTLDHAPLSP
jgi:hypothetical protein